MNPEPRCRAAVIVRRRSRRTSRRRTRCQQKELINRTGALPARAPGAQGVGDVRAGNLNELLMCVRPCAVCPRRTRSRTACARSRAIHQRRARRPERGRLHLRQGRPIGAIPWRRDRPHRRPAAEARPAAAVPHRLLHVHEVVRELLRQGTGETVMMHVPYQGDGKIPSMRDYVVKQLKDVIPTLERISASFDIDRLRQYMRQSARPREDLVWVLQSAKNPVAHRRLLRRRLLHRAHLLRSAARPTRPSTTRAAREIEERVAAASAR